MKTKKIKMFGVELSFHPLFVIFALFLLYNNCFLFINYLIAMFIHEYAHSYVAYKCGYKIGNIKLLPFGICLNLNNCKITPIDEIKIALAGPMINLIVYLLILSCFWIYPPSFIILYNFAFCNIIIAIFNLLPVMPLDGGRILVGALSNFWVRQKVVRICYVINCIVGSCLLILFVVMLPLINLTFLFLGLFIIIAGIPTKKENLMYNYIKFSYNKKDTNIIKTKIVVVDEETPIYKLFALVSVNYYLLIYVKDKFNKIRYTIDEFNFEKICYKYSPTKQIGEVILGKL